MKKDKRLKDLDHFDLLLDMAGEIKALSARIETIVNSLNMSEIVEERKILSSELAGVEVMKNLVRVHLSVMDDEWREEISKAEKSIIDRLTKTKLESLEDFI